MRYLLLVAALLVTAVALAPSDAQAAEVTFGGFGQFWYTYNDYGTYDKDAKAYHQVSDSQFMMKRVRLRATADLTNVVSFFSLVDFVGGPTADDAHPGAILSPQLMDFYTNIKVHKYFQILAGQFIIPFGYEGPRNPYELEMLTYAMVWGTGKKYAGRQLGFFPYLRDLGVMLHGDVHGFNYKLALVDGNENAGDGSAQGFIKGGDSVLKGGNKWKDLVGRVGYDAKHIRGGVSGYYGWDNGAGAKNPDESYYDQIFKKMRVGADFKFDYKGGLLFGEFIYGVNETITKQVGPTATISPLGSWGAYLTGGYTIKEKVQPLLRVEYFAYEQPAPSGTAAKTATTATSGTAVDTEYAGIFGAAAAVNYYFSKHAKVTLLYERLMPDEKAQKKYYTVDAIKAAEKKPDQSIVEQQIVLQLGVNY